jgi:hypothetical protein
MGVMEKELKNDLMLIKLLLVLIISMITGGIIQLLALGAGTIIVLYLLVSWGLSYVDSKKNHKD